MGEEKPASACEEDESLCPTSSRLATDVACDCRCVAGFAGITPTRDFDGEISACLPSDLNLRLASPEQRDALSQLTSEQYNQRVFQYCSNDVANFIEDLIEQQQRPRDLQGLCMGPRIRCSCTTSGAQAQSSVCSAPCADRECDRDNCISLLRVGGIVDASACACSRVNACGSSTPASGEEPLCMNRIAALRRKAKRRRAPRVSAAGQLVGRRQRAQSLMEKPSRR